MKFPLEITGHYSHRQFHTNKSIFLPHFLFVCSVLF